MTMSRASMGKQIAFPGKLKKKKRTVASAMSDIKAAARPHRTRRPKRAFK